MISTDELSSNRIHDKIAESYGFDVSASLSARLKYDLLLKYVKPDDSVLDIGCANGIHMRLLAERCRYIVGIDINEKMLDIAKRTLAVEAILNARLERRSAADLGFPGSSFDIVYSYSTLLLVPNIGRALAEIARVLRPGGVAILDLCGRWNLSRIYWSRYYRRHGHFGLHAFRYRDIAARLETLGLPIIEAHALGFLDQWRYIPGLHWCKWLDRWIHRSLDRDLDYRISNLRFVFPLANRWYVVCRRTT